jgi:hypothetical protein
MDLKRLLKRGALIAATNWQVVLIQFVAQTIFQVLLAVPVLGAAILVAALLGGDLITLLQGTVRDMFGTVATALMSEPVALASFVAAFTVVLLVGSAVMFLAKGGTITVLIASHDAAGTIERDPLTAARLRSASAFTVPRFTAGCSALFRRYLVLGLILMVVYAASGAAYLSFVYLGYRAVGGGPLMVGWTMIAAVAGGLLVVWITAVNLCYLLVQIAIAAADISVAAGVREIALFLRKEFRELSGIFLLVLAIVVAATFASALAWAGVGLVAFVPLVGLVVIPLQILALLLRRLVFEYIGVTAAAAYVTLYRWHVMPTATAAGSTVAVLSAHGAAPRERRGA